MIKKLLETALHKVYKVCSYSTTYKIERLYKGVWFI